MALSEQAERKKQQAAQARVRLSEDEKRKAEDKERKKAEVRARLEEAARAKKGKKGFMTPERKKKLRAMLRQNAAQALKQEQERKAAERREALSKRIGNPQSHDVGQGQNKLLSVCKEYYNRIAKLEDIKYDLEYDVRQKDFVINELSIQVNDLRGKFVKPSLKKVSKYDGKLEKMAKIAAKAEMDFRNNLKRVQSTKFTMEEEKDASAKPEWASREKGKELEVEEADD